MAGSSANSVITSTFSFSVSVITSAVKSVRYSKKFIRKLFARSVINILYNRIDLVDAAEQFEEKTMRDVQFIVCKKDNNQHPVIYNYFRWIKGAAHAFEKGYLKEFYLLFKNRDGVLVEHYKFNFDYDCVEETEEQNNVGTECLYEITKQIFVDIKKLSKYKKFEWKEDNIFISAEIVYNDSVPLYYQPPHNDDCILINKESSVVTLIQNQQDRYTMVQLNDITTGYHTFQCNFGGQIFFVNPLSVTSTNFSKDEEEEVMVTTQSFEYTNETFCLCQSNIKHKSIPIAECVVCKKVFHCVCFGFFEIPKKFRCINCGGNANIPNNIVIDSVKMSRIRLVIAFCYKTMELPHKIMKGFSDKTVKKQLWESLEVLDVVLKNNGRYFLNRAKVKDGNFLKMVFGSQVIVDSEELIDLTNEDDCEEGVVVKRFKY